MVEQQEFLDISEKAQQLLQQAENYDVDFKRDLGGLKSEDLVAFANSISGGAILIGVDDDSNITGCQIGDKEKLGIINKAQACSPPVAIEIFAENISECPFYRVEIPSGENKPYSTNNGTYKLRGDGRNLALLPEQLLDMYLERETTQFINRFQQATQVLESNLEKANTQLEAGLANIFRSVKSMDLEVSKYLERIASSAENAESLADDAYGEAGDTAYQLNQLDTKLDTTTDFLAQNLLRLLEHFNVEDTRTSQLKSDLIIGIKFVKKENPRLSDEQIMQYILETYRGHTKEKVQEILSDLLRISTQTD